MGLPIMPRPINPILCMQRLYPDIQPEVECLEAREVMPENTYLDWVLENTDTKWWHDSAEANELQVGLQRGAIGVTTNPYLANMALVKDRPIWGSAIDAVLAQKLAPELKA